MTASELHQNAVWAEIGAELMTLRRLLLEGASGRGRVEDALAMMFREGMAGYIGPLGWFNLVSFVYGAHSIGGAA